MDNNLIIYKTDESRIYKSNNFDDVIFSCCKNYKIKKTILEQTQVDKNEDRINYYTNMRVIKIKIKPDGLYKKYFFNCYCIMKSFRF